MTHRSEIQHHDTQYLNLLEDILDHGTQKGDRTGTGTLCTVGQTMKFDLTGGRIPLLTTKKVLSRLIIHELLWMISGDTNIRYLKDNNVSIWDDWLIAGTEEYRDLSVDERYALYEKHMQDVQKRTNDAIAKAPDDPAVAMYPHVAVLSRVTFHTDDELHRAMDGFDIPRQALIAGDIGKGYGSQWRAWTDTRIIGIDQVDAYAKRGFSLQGRLEENALANMGAGQPQVVVQRVIDQLAEAVRLLKENPDSRRIIVSAWNVAEIDEMALPPCHLLFHFCTEMLWTVNSDGKKEYDFPECVRIARENGSNNVEAMYLAYQDILDSGVDTTCILSDIEGEFKDYGVKQRKLSCVMYQRSVDTMLGAPFNIVQYALMVHLMAQAVDMSPNTFTWDGGDVHIYSNHTNGAEEQLGRSPMKEVVSRVKLNKDIKNLFDFKFEDIEIMGYHSHGPIKFEIAV